MRCRKARKLLSDELDGALVPRRGDRLGAHLRSCPACREYRLDLGRIRGALAPPAERPDGYWAGFEMRLEAKLDREGRGGGPARAPFPARRRPALAAAALGLVAILALWLVRTDRQAPGMTAGWFPDIDPLAPLLLEAEADPELGRAVDREIRASIEELAPGPDAAVLRAADPLFWQGLSEEELGEIVAGLERENGLGGPK